jgi:hypothetical protein
LDAVATVRDMGKSRFVIYTNWDPEADSAAVHAERVRESLTEFGLISPALRSWGILDFDDGTSVPVENAERPFSQIVSRGLVAVHGSEYSQPRIRFNVNGAGRRSFRGVCAAIFEAEFDDRPDPAIVAYPVLKAMMIALAPIWNATYAQVYTNAIQSYWDDPPRIFELSWMTYLSDTFAEMIVIPESVFVEQVPGEGVVLSAADGDFDVANAKHMAAARDLRDALNPLARLYRRPWEKS